MSLESKLQFAEQKPLCINMPRARLGCSNPSKALFFLLIAIGSILLLQMCCKFRLVKLWKGKDAGNGKDTEFCRYTKNASKTLDLPRLLSEEFYIRMLTARSPPRGDLFDPQINETELRVMINLMWKFLDVSEKCNVTMMMYGSTLLGSYRHHGVIPWDDHTSVLVDVNDKANLRQALKGNLDLHLTAEKGENAMWRVSSKSACLHKSLHGCWPFISVSFYRLQDGWVCDLISGRYSYPETVTFPLHKRPFMGRWVNSPRDALSFLSIAYEAPSDLCTSLQYSHKSAIFSKAPPEAVSCKNLSSTYPFVLRALDSAPSCRGVLEALKFLSGRAVGKMPVNEPMGAANTETYEAWVEYITAILRTQMDDLLAKIRSLVKPHPGCGNEEK